MIAFWDLNTAGQAGKKQRKKISNLKELGKYTKKKINNSKAKKEVGQQ